jgi:hypothetical protein
VAGGVAARVAMLQHGRRRWNLALPGHLAT